MEAGNEHKTLFWDDSWCCRRPLKLEVSSILNITSNRNASMFDYWVEEEGRKYWDIPLRRHLND